MNTPQSSPHPLSPPSTLRQTNLLVYGGFAPAIGMLSHVMKVGMVDTRLKLRTIKNVLPPSHPTPSQTNLLKYREFTPAIGMLSHAMKVGMADTRLKMLTTKHILAAPLQFNLNRLLIYAPVEQITRINLTDYQIAAGSFRNCFHYVSCGCKIKLFCL